MANTVKLGAKPKNFKRAVTFKMLDGTDSTIECTFKYRTRLEFGAFIDALFKSAKKTSDDAAKNAGDDATPRRDDFSMESLMESTCDSNADYLLQVLDGWNLDEDMNRANLQQLCDEIPAAANAIMDAYRAAVSEGRLGN